MTNTNGEYRRFLALLVWLVPNACLAAEDAPTPDVVAPEVAAISSLVENGGFEEGGALPAYWRRYPTQDADGHRLVRDTDVAHTGRASGLVVQAPVEPGSPSPNL